MTTVDRSTTVEPATETAAPVSSYPHLDRAITELAAGVAAWADRPLASRAELLRATHETMRAQATRWATTARDIKGLDASSPLVGEEWISGPYAALAGLGATAKTVAALAEGRSPLDGVRTGTAPGGRVTVPVLPRDAHEALLLHGFRAEVWLRPGVSVADATRTAGLGQLTPRETGGVGLVLGAGNITSIPPLDVLYEVVAHNRSVLLKLNPVMAPMLSVYLAALEPLVSAGMLRVVQGGAAEGAYLTQHPGISHVHITGSVRTHDAIVWGTGPDADARRAAGTPLLDKPITSELGGVSPIIVVPGRWTSHDLRFQAEHVATQRLHNGGYNCIAGQLVVLSSDWEQKDDFLRELRSALERAPRRAAWYPGSDDRVASAQDAYPGCERLADGTRLLVPVTPDDASTLETTEYFSPVLGVLELPGTGQAFLDAAVETANRDLLGTLGANVLVDPAEKKRLGDGFRDAVARLEYGTVAINAWTGVGFLTASATWGAFPGHTLDDVQSGIGVVHNAMLLDGAERTVVTGPFRPFPRSVRHGEVALFPKPPWFVTARSAQTTGRRLTAFAGDPSWAKMPAIFASAFRA
ncbi:aldehyde dehydrogenase family protein [Luteimicrobium subarcticum]|uniref:Aldehyde dehydrogenase family protein n=1 Tax=Luteimicrobium subarcticum TaxID=620910 RepID=A0A2M8WW64_9MICO|nr:aldehyde dehydrogenase family protein [Luteimicrobium subarcticum]PJI95158.1 aldehyde dehydrogenase family protein [Luteimicrobium subarcticum]